MVCRHGGQERQLVTAVLCIQAFRERLYRSTLFLLKARDLPAGMQVWRNFTAAQRVSGLFCSFIPDTKPGTATKLRQAPIRCMLNFGQTMKIISLVIFIFFCTSVVSAQSPTQSLLPNRNALTTTFNIFTDTLSGTCFTTLNGKEEYVVTAKHLFRRKTKSGDSVLVKINVNKTETPFKAKIYFHTNPLVDIAIIKLPKTISQTETLSLKSGDSYFIGQECLFLGYPIFNIGSLTKTEKIPFVKKAIISAFYEENGIEFILLDGHNNPGFSGGPTLTYSDKIENQFIFGIVSGYINQSQDIQVKNAKSDSLNYSIKINENSGIIIAYPAKYITETIINIH
jgi:hypothetical protein